MKIYKKRKSFFSILIRNYIIFTIVNFFLVLILIISFLLILAYSLGAKTGLSKNDLSYLQNLSFFKVNLDELVGSNGGMQIVNSVGKVIYNRGHLINDKTSYTANELECINNYNLAGQVIKSYPITTSDGEKGLIIEGVENNDVEISVYTNNSNYTDNSVWYQVLNSNLEVVASGGTKYNDIKKYTKTELEYLLNDLPNNYLIMKYPFKGDDGQNYTLILNIQKTASQIMANRMGYGILEFLGLAILMYIVFIFIFVLWINRKVKKPSEKLNEAMVSFSNGERIEITDYKGPDELMKICDNFNMMLVKLKDSEEKRELLEQEKQRMISDISHDLKTPITSIKGYSKALLDGMVEEEEKDRVHEIIYNKSEKLTSLVNTLYEYSRLEHPDLTFRFEKLDICEFMRTYIIDKYNDIYDLGFKIEINIPDEIFMCSIDKIEMTRAIDNILNNALKHNQKGTCIFISIFKSNEFLKIIIANDGTRIPDDIAKDIFNPFVVGDISRNIKGGTGLGMSITEKIINKHGGTIKLRRDAEYTTMFEITLK